MRKKIFYIFLIFLILGALFYLPFYGFSYPPCGSREKEIKIPTMLINKQLSVKSSDYSSLFYYQNNGNLKFIDECLPILGKVSNTIRVDDGKIIGMAGKQKYQGSNNFQVTNALMTRAYGIHGIDSGNDWHLVYIIKNTEGQKFRIYCSDLVNFGAGLNCN